jgi:hypothetical protein
VKGSLESLGIRSGCSVRDCRLFARHIQTNLHPSGRGKNPSINQWSLIVGLIGMINVSEKNIISGLPGKFPSQALGALAK